jgi:3-keto-5-aminohexanoate cleavage enzyme
MTPLILTVALNGGRWTKADHPGLPLTPIEIAREAELCCAAGATLLHLHVRDREGGHSLDPAHYRAAIAAVRSAIGEQMAIQVTTETVGRYSPSDQMSIVRQLLPEAVSLALAELIPDETAAGVAAAFLSWLSREQIAPQYLLHTPNDVGRFHCLRRRGVIPQRRPFALFLLGHYARPAELRPRDVLPYLKAHDADCPWAICAVGPNERACVLTAVGLGGHAQVGFEHNFWQADGRLAASNAELVEPIATGARLLGRNLADIATTRAFLAESAR